MSRVLQSAFHARPSYFSFSGLRARAETLSGPLFMQDTSKDLGKEEVQISPDWENTVPSDSLSMSKIYSGLKLIQPKQCTIGHTVNAEITGRAKNY